jgi:hypothetical protein
VWSITSIAGVLFLVHSSSCRWGLFEKRMDEEGGRGSVSGNPGLLTVYGILGLLCAYVQDMA